MYRALQPLIEKDLSKKMVFLVGPRQVGKTWLAKEIMKKYTSPLYLNFDVLEDREIIKDQSWRENRDLLVFDEIHKMPEWKNYLKGVFDGKPENMHILVTGSARMDTYKHTGDSLVGRVFIHHLLPFTPSEIPSFSLEHFMERGGFPESFLAEDFIDSKRWRSQYIQGLIQRDVLDFDTVHNFRDLQLLLQLLQSRVGSPVSYQSLAEDLSISPVTVKKYIGIFESLFIVFRVSPFSKNIAQSIKKNSKIYFFDTGMVNGDEGVILENTVAISLKKHVYLHNDQLGTNFALEYLRLKNGKEVDFCIQDQGCVLHAMEVKNSQKNIDPNLSYFCSKYGFRGVQIVNNLKKEYIDTNNKIEVRKVFDFLQELK